MFIIACLLSCLPKAKEGGIEVSPFSPEKMSHHATVLSSDAFEGRGTFEPGLDKAASYISSEYERLGLSFFENTASYSLPYSVFEYNWTANQKLELNSNDVVDIISEDHWVPFPFSDNGNITGEVVFAGYGITAPEYEWDDYDGLEVKDKVVLVLRREPGDDDPESQFNGTKSSTHASFRKKAEQAKAHGAIGMLIVTDPKHPNQTDDFRSQPSYFMEKISEGDPPQEEDVFLSAHISQSVAGSLLGEHSLEELQNLIEDGAQASTVQIPRTTAHLSWEGSLIPKVVTTKNIIGVIEGSDPELKSEWVVIGAHYDHLGSFVGQGDTIYNGADDNSSGVSGLLSLAEAFSQSPTPPKRSIVFAAFSGEELGLLGSKSFVNQIDPRRVSFMLNFDMIGRNPEGPLTIYGDGYTKGLGDLILSLNSETNLDISLAGEKYFGASDHHPFYKKNRPFLFFFMGLHEDYHQTSDHIEHLDFEQMSRITRLGYSLINTVAQGDYDPIFLHNLGWLGARLVIGDDGVVLYSIGEPSRAKDFGLQSGDTILKFNDMTNKNEIIDALANVESEQAFELQLQREAETFSFTVERQNKGYAGFYPDNIPPETSSSLMLSDDEGFLILKTVPDGPADLAGLVSGDIILKMNGYNTSFNTVRNFLQYFGEDELISCVVLRDGKEQEISLRLGKVPQR